MSRPRGVSERCFREVLLEARRRRAHRLWHMPQRIAFRHPHVGVAEHLLDQPRVPPPARYSAVP